MKALETLFEHWNNLPQGLFPRHMVPSDGFSTNCLLHIAALSEKLTIQQAIDELKSEIDLRNRNNPKEEKGSAISISIADVRIILDNHGIKHPNIKAERSRVAKNDERNVRIEPRRYDQYIPPYHPS